MIRQRLRIEPLLRGALLVLGCVAAALASSTAQAAERPARIVEVAVHRQGRMRLVEGVPYLTLAGTYEEMGEQYGALMKDRIAPGPPPPSHPLAAEERHRLEALLGPRYGPFLRGVAAGQGRAFDDVLGSVFELPAQGCSSILAKAHPAGGGTRLLHAKNLDLPGPPVENSHVVVELRPAGELRMITTTNLGIADGMNERGITVSVNSGPACPGSSAGRPLHPQTEVLTGRMLDLLATARSLADADRVITAAPIDASMLLIVGSAADGDGAIFDLACGTVRKTGMRAAETLFATNQYLHPDLTPPADLRQCPRYRLLDDRLRGARIAGADDVAAALADAGGEYGVNNFMTRHSVIYDGGALALRLALRPGYAAWGTWIEYDWAHDRATVLRDALFDLGPVALRSQPPEKVAAIREVLPGYSDQVGLWAELDRTLAQAGAARAGPGYTVYHGGADGRVDVETVQPVVALAHDAGRVRFRVADAVQVASVTHHGPHSTLRAAHAALAAWMEEHGYAAAGPVRENWLRGSWNEPEPRRWTTVVEVPVAPRAPEPANRGAGVP